MRKRPFLGLILVLFLLVLSYVVFWSSERSQVYHVAEQELQQRYHVPVRIERMDLSYPMPTVLIYLITPFSHDHKWWVYYELPGTDGAKAVIVSKDTQGHWAVISR